MALTACSSGGGTRGDNGDAQYRDDNSALPAAPSDGTVMQIVSHADDDFYFMNMDIGQSLAAGRPSVSVYLTAGEADGINVHGKDADKSPAPANKPAYVEARQNGLRAAYAKMAAGDRSSPWRREVLPTRAGNAELDTLIAKPSVRLVWLGLHEAGKVSGYNPDSLRGLWTGKVKTLGTLPAAGSPVTKSDDYSREQLVDTLADLFDRFRPGYFRTLDPTPDSKGKDSYSDHQDHTYGAWFAQSAMRKYWAEGGKPRTVVQNYVGYLNGDLPPALNPAGQKAKKDLLDIYGWADAFDCGDPAGCGDKKVGGDSPRNGWGLSTRYRRGGGTSWLQPESDGRLAAFAVLNGQLATWRETGPGTGAWTGPVLLPGGGLDSQIDVVRLPDGRLEVFATRTTLSFDAAEHRRVLVTAVQKTPGGDFGDWRDLGDPNGGNAQLSLQMGPPKAAVGADGAVSVFLRNGHHGLSGRSSGPDGAWAAGWTDMGGKDLLDGLATARQPDGRLEVFGTTRTSVLSWLQETPNGAFAAARPTGLPVTTGPLSALPADGGAVRLVWRETRTARVMESDRTAPDAAWTSAPIGGDGPGGFGAVATAARPGAPAVVAAIDADGTVATSAAAAKDGFPGNWTPHAGVLNSGAPSVAYDSTGRPVVAIVGTDSTLHVARRAAGGSGDGFGVWEKSGT